MNEAITVNGEPATLKSVEQDLFDVTDGHPEWKGPSQWVTKSPVDVNGNRRRRAIVEVIEPIPVGVPAVLSNGDTSFVMMSIAASGKIVTFERVAKDW